MDKLHINKDATFHKVLKEDALTLKSAWNEFKDILDYIVKRDSLPEGVWFPSEDFKWLIKQ